MSFSTGSSWGTFAIMMPLAMPMAQTFSIRCHSGGRGSLRRPVQGLLLPDL
ncbi:MAG: Na+/H+ antiporter NhaC family protein [Blautia marasmi]